MLKEAVTLSLQSAFPKGSVQVEDFSHEHSVPSGSESHLRVRIVSEQFRGLRSVARHRKVYAILTEQFDKGLHALQLQLLTTEEDTESPLETPKCLGGSKSN